VTSLARAASWSAHEQMEQGLGEGGRTVQDPSRTALEFPDSESGDGGQRILCKRFDYTRENAIALHHTFLEDGFSQVERVGLGWYTIGFDWLNEDVDCHVFFNSRTIGARCFLFDACRLPFWTRSSPLCCLGCAVSDHLRMCIFQMATASVKPVATAAPVALAVNPTSNNTAPAK
jgi:hypothetical protein